MRYNKFKVSPKAQRTVYGITFASKKEMQRYLILLSRQQAGEIRDLEMQVPYVLQEGFIYGGKKYREIRYVADFRYFDKKVGDYIVEDVKGFRTQTYLLKIKLFLYKYRNVCFVEI